MEHRWGNRITVNLPVWLSGCGLCGPGVLRNVSSSGGLIETPLPLATLTMVRVQIPRCGEMSPAATWGFIVRESGQGFGVEWCDTAPLPFDHLESHHSLMSVAVAP
jgi:hypothetical protein